MRSWELDALWQNFGVGIRRQSCKKHKKYAKNFLNFYADCTRRSSFNYSVPHPLVKFLYAKKQTTIRYHYFWRCQWFLGYLSRKYKTMSAARPQLLAYIWLTGFLLLFETSVEPKLLEIKISHWGLYDTKFNSLQLLPLTFFW